MRDMDKNERSAEIARRVDAGQSEREIARALGISRSSVWDAKQAAKKAAAR